MTDTAAELTTAGGTQPVATDAVAWLGIGRMGRALTERLLRSGVAATVWNRTPERTEPLVALGAVAVEHPVDAARHDVVFSSLLDDAALYDVALGPHGLLTGALVPKIWVDCSTVSPQISQQVSDAAAQRGTAFVAAPVSGNPGVVHSGAAVLAVSGPDDAVRAVAPLLSMLAGTVTRVGVGHEARIVKLCTNILVGVLAEALAEALVLAEGVGVSRRAVMEFINESVVGSAFTRYKTPALVDLELTPTFTPEGQRKDLRLALGIAADHDVTLPVVAAAEMAFSRLIGSGLGRDRDFAALILQAAHDAGIALEAR
jgi:3-hydroxyisobutyrate dehydrogenase